jgi:hypothetical protein
VNILRPFEGRWLSAKEKANSMMFPVFSEAAEAAGVSQIPEDCSPNHSQLGNSMHVGVFSCLLMAVYSCVQFIQPEEA